jgi:hypothetical protein
MPDSQDDAVFQALYVRAIDGHVALSARELAEMTGLSKDSAFRATNRLLIQRRIVIIKPSEGSQATIWGIPGLLKDGMEGLEDPAGFVSQIVSDRRSVDDGNAVPTMPFQLPSPKGEGGSWFEGVYRQLTRLHSRIRQGRLEPKCLICCDSGYYVQRLSIEYDRAWLNVCTCEAGQSKDMPPLDPPYVPDRQPGICLMCGNSGWIAGPDLVWTGIRYEQVQRCYSCKRTWG